MWAKDITNVLHLILPDTSLKIIPSLWYISLSLSLSLRFTVTFPAGTRLSPFWILLELRVMEVVVTTGDVRRRARLQSNQHY